MNGVLTHFGDLSAAARLRLQNIARYSGLEFIKPAVIDSMSAQQYDYIAVYACSAPWDLMRTWLQSLKKAHPSTPVLLTSDVILEPAVLHRISPELVFAFCNLSELETTVASLRDCADIGEVSKLPGVTVNQGQTGARSLKTPQLRELPLPHQKLNLKASLDSQGYYPLLHALGCEQRCHHCNIVSREGFRRSFSPEELVYVLTLLKDHGLRRIHLVDQELFHEPEKLLEFSSALSAANLALDLKANLHLMPYSENLINLLAECGLKEVHFVLFAGSDRVLFHNNVPARIKEIKRTIASFSQSGIHVKVRVLTGLPFEGWVDYFRTLTLLSELRPYLQEVTEISSARIEQNSLFFRRHEEYGIQVVSGDSNLWVRQERDHLNDPSTRRLKVLYLEQQMRTLGLFHRQTHCDQFDLSTIKDLHTRFLDSRVDIALITTPPWGYLNPPVGIAKLASYLKAKGRKSAVFDFNVELYLRYEDFQRLWHVENKSYWSNDLSFEVIRSIYDQDIAGAVDRILDTNTRLIGFSAVDPKERMTAEFIQRLREQDSELTIILGGQVCGTTEYRNIFFDKLGHKGIDCYVVGEGEDTLMEILGALDEGRALQGIAGTCYVDEQGQWHHASARPKVDLWNAPITTYEEFDLQNYTCQELLVEWSRGCIGTCSFCKAKVLDGKFRSYSPEHVVASLDHYVSNYGIRQFTICDLAVNGNWKLLEQICDAIIQSGLKVQLRAQGIPRRQMKLPLLKKMAAAGFVEMQWGVESGSDNVLKAMDKDWMFTIAEAQEVIRNSHLAEIKTCMFCMVGFPTETEEDHRMTYDFIDRNAEYLDMVKSINSLHIITDTPIHHKALELGVNLPERDYHYLWSMDGNTHDIRQRRVKELLELVRIKNLECVETNYLEGRQYELIKDYKEEFIPMDERIARLRKDINQLIDYRMNQQEVFEGDNNPKLEFLAANRDLLGVFHGKKAFVGPRTVEIDLGNNCNFNCVGCWCHCDHLEELKTPAQKRKQHLPLETLQTLIKDLAESGTQSIQLAGPGEPFAHPQIMDIIRYIKGNGLELHIITNFSYIDHAMAQEIMDLRVDSLTCSLWAGSEEVFVRTHPNQTVKTFHKIREILAFFGNAKKYNRYPRIKIYNVISRLNVSDIENMVALGREVKADTMEFTVVDTVVGKTDFLGLTLDDVQKIEEQFQRISAGATYPDPPGRKHLQGLSKEQAEEHYELHAKFFTDPEHYAGFSYEPINKVMTCKAGMSNSRMVHDPEWICANVFYFPEQGCMGCKHLNDCEIDKKDYSIKTRFFAVLGFGSFMRRAKASAMERSRKEGSWREVQKLNLLPPTPFVDTLPCTIGWSYTRITTAGDVIPCCKGYNKPLGNLYQNHFRHIWNDHKMREFRYKAKNFSKGDAYFEPIGCYKACDNVGHNLEIHRRIQALKPREIRWLQEEAKKVDPT